MQLLRRWRVGIIKIVLACGLLALAAGQLEATSQKKPPDEPKPFAREKQKRYGIPAPANAPKDPYAGATWQERLDNRLEQMDPKEWEKFQKRIDFVNQLAEMGIIDSLQRLREKVDLLERRWEYLGQLEPQLVEGVEVLEQRERLEFLKWPVLERLKRLELKALADRMEQLAERVEDGLANRLDALTENLKPQKQDALRDQVGEQFLGALEAEVERLEQMDRLDQVDQVGVQLLAAIEMEVERLKRLKRLRQLELEDFDKLLHLLKAR